MVVTNGPRPRRTTTAIRIRWARVACLLAVAAAVAIAAGHQLLVSPSTAAPRIAVPRMEKPRAPLARRSDHRLLLGEADGALPDGTLVFDEAPGVANLDSALLAALRRAAVDAARAGVRLVVDSGWRSAAYQQHLFDEAVSQHGSEEEAARWVATPGTSAHVSGDAVDIGPAAAAAWLSEHGAEYGLCRIYANEPWHFELRPRGVDRGCPPRYADPTHDPRMRQ